MSEIKKNCKKIYEEKQNDRTKFEVAENNEESQDKQFEIAALVEQTEINYSKTFTRDTKYTEDIKEKSKNNEAKIDFIDENFEVAENNEESQDKQFEIAALVKQTEMNCNETFTRNPTSTEDTKEKSKNNEPKIDFIDENEAINEMKETNSIDIMEAVMPSLAFVKGFTF